MLKLGVRVRGNMMLVKITTEVNSLMGLPNRSFSHIPQKKHASSSFPPEGSIVVTVHL